MFKKIFGMYDRFSKWLHELAASDFLEKKKEIAVIAYNGPYFSDDIKMDIQSEKEHDMVQRILRMDATQMKELAIDLETEANLVKGFAQSREAIIQAKAIIRLLQRLKKEQLHPQVSLLDIYEQIQFGNIIADANATANENWTKRHQGW